LYRNELIDLFFFSAQIHRHRGDIVFVHVTIAHC